MLCSGVGNASSFDYIMDILNMVTASLKLLIMFMLIFSRLVVYTAQQVDWGFPIGVLASV
jgi:hypothetical protein